MALKNLDVASSVPLQPTQLLSWGHGPSSGSAPSPSAVQAPSIWNQIPPHIKLCGRWSTAMEQSASRTASARHRTGGISTATENVFLLSDAVADWPQWPVGPRCQPPLGPPLSL